MAGTTGNKPTSEQFSSYQELYDFYNKSLFSGKLPLILLNLSRKANSCGFFAAERWQKGKSKTHEISINPAYLSQAPFREVCQTLVHEMCHLWQFAFGRPSRTGYHNKEWAEKMEDIGLMPSDTAQPGGSRTGQAMADYVIDGGHFDKIFISMPKHLCLPWVSKEVISRAVIPIGDHAEDIEEGEIDGESAEESLSGKKVKYSCPTEDCRLNVWGKPGLNVVCGDCGRRLGVRAPKPKKKGRLAVHVREG